MSSAKKLNEIHSLTNTQNLSLQIIFLIYSESLHHGDSNGANGFVLAAILRHKMSKIVLKTWTAWYKLCPQLRN